VRFQGDGCAHGPHARSNDEATRDPAAEAHKPAFVVIAKMRRGESNALARINTIFLYMLR
jgi:hypothetical protein